MPKQFKSKRTDLPPLEFEITFDRLNDDGEWVEETEKFTARPMIPSGVMLDIASAMEKSVGIQTAEVIKMMNTAIIAEDKNRFTELINDPDVAITIETLGEILEWLAEEYAGRPT